jgi:hypothetical protein
MAETLGANNAARLCGSHDIIVSQVVPFPHGNSAAAIRYRDELAAFDPNEVPGFVTFEGWAAGKIWAEVIRRTAATGEVSADRIITTFENDFHDVDLGIGTIIDYSDADHLGSDQIFATQLDETCTYQDFELDPGA